MSGLKSHLSKLMPLAEACSVLGEDCVSQIVSSLLLLQSPTPPANLEEETSNLVRAMFYTTNAMKGNEGANQAGLMNQSQTQNHIPPPIREAWKKLASRPCMLDKLTLIKFLVPVCAQPHSGPGGHMGLFDCLTYALQTKPPASVSTSSAALTAPPLVGIPDIVIFLAICQNYLGVQQEFDEDGIVSFDVSYDGADPAVVKMAQWMFMVYDGYQKKNLLVRDTFHRFLSDVYGDDSYQTPEIRELLDRVFSRGNQLTSREFVEAIVATLTYSPHPSHILLDWMASLSVAMRPIGKQAESSERFLQTIDQQLHWLPQICDDFGLAENRLYEIKRRFHSLVQSSQTVIQGDPMNAEQTSSTSSSSSGNGVTKNLPKHVIPMASFLQACCTENDEQGHGGYLPQNIAEQVFTGVAKMNRKAEEKEKPPKFWDLTHVLKFSGLCVRAESDTELIKFILHHMLGVDSSTPMNKEQISSLMVLLCRHMEFRLLADRSAWEKADDEEETKLEMDESSLSVKAAKRLGLLPDSVDDAQKTVVAVDVLVDHFYRLVDSRSELVSMEHLLTWHQATKVKNLERLGSFLKELRLIASVLFGVPPKLASMENTIIMEIQERHKARYPQTDVSRRGPRGTVWYIIDDLWYRTWTGMIQQSSFTPDDGKDLRDKASGSSFPRRLGKIGNKGLLRENGSLALRVDIKWRRDYEILPPLAWSALQAWYDGGPPIYRSVVPYQPAGASPRARSPRATMRTENEIELYPFFVTMFLCDASSRGEARPFQQAVPVSRVSPIRVLLVQLCKGLDVNPDLGRLWMVESTDSGDDSAANGNGDWLLDIDKNISDQRNSRVRDQGGSTNISLLLELKDDESGLWPRGIDGREWTFDRKDPNAEETGDGVVGLHNMGNTCYLNSSIQCLSHTPIFRDYFTSKCYLNDINTTNPLGHQGHLAQVSALLINHLWKKMGQQTIHQPKRVTAPGSYAPVSAPALTPKTFKESLGKFNEHFAGNEQHDAQELLAFLLGGLSEDLNRIVEKPYIQAPDSDGRPDAELADIWWSNHLRREMSIIVALFTGQYKSLLKCKSCKYESARFEPFSFLQVPLPEDDTIPVSLILYAIGEGKEAMKYSVRVHNNGTLYDVLISLAKVLHADAKKEGKEDEDVGNSSEPVSESQRLDAIYAKLAQNMAVVDMREGYIFKIAPVSAQVLLSGTELHRILKRQLLSKNAWRLPDLQNKDTGDLPLLQVYELDPMPQESVAYESKAATLKKESGKKDGKDNGNYAEDEDDASNSSKDEGRAERSSFLALAQRRSEYLSKEILHPMTHRAFGTPLLLRVTDLEKLTGRGLYDTVAKRLKNFVPKTALKFLEGGTKPNEEKEGNGSSTDKRTKIEIRKDLQKTFTDMEDVAAGPVPRYGFRLRLASRDGRRCAICPWYDCCIGCLVPDDDKPTVVMCGDSIVIDWHFAVDVATNGFGTRGTQAEQAPSKQPSMRGRVPIKNHYSCDVGGKSKGNPGAITLEDCLDAFAKEEKIPEVSFGFTCTYRYCFLMFAVDSRFCPPFAGLLLEMQGFPGSNQTDEPLATSSSCHHPLETFSIYAAYKKKAS